MSAGSSSGETSQEEAKAPAAAGVPLLSVPAASSGGTPPSSPRELCGGCRKPFIKGMAVMTLPDHPGQGFCSLGCLPKEQPRVRTPRATDEPPASPRKGRFFSRKAKKEGKEKKKKEKA